MEKQGKSFAICGLFIALFAISSKLQIPSPFIPFTMQTAVLLLCLLILPDFLPLLTITVYLFFGLIGLPLFSQGGGFSYILQPTFGYLLSFIICAIIKGLFFKRPTGYKSGIILSLISIFTVHLLDTLYAFLIYNLHLHTQFTFIDCFIVSSLIFIPTDLIWCFLSPLVSKRISKVIKL